MDFVGMRQDKIVLKIDVKEAANLLDVLLEVTSHWDLLDTVPLSPSFEEVTELCRATLMILQAVFFTPDAIPLGQVPLRSRGGGSRLARCRSL